MIEFYTIDEELWCKTEESTFLLTEHDTEQIHYMIDIIMQDYPQAYDALVKAYCKSSDNVPYFKYLIVRRFCKCNFGSLDMTKEDVTSSNFFNFEKVHCPLRGECKYECIICMPQISTKLSTAEYRVMKLLYDGLAVEDIAEKLYLSANTVKNHIKHSYKKLKVHEKSDFVKLAKDNQMFNH